MNEKTFNATLLGIVNSQKIELKGEGTLHPEEGVTKGYYKILSLPKGFNAQLFSNYLITGYPQIALENRGSKNIFSGKTVRYTRRVKYENGGEITFNALCKNVDGHLESIFLMEGNVDSPKLTDIEPLVEVWVPKCRNNIVAHFTTAWITDTGKTFVSYSETEYHIEGEIVDIDFLQHRYVTIQTTVKGNELTKHQQVSLFRNFPNHKVGKPLPGKLKGEQSSHI